MEAPKCKTCGQRHWERVCSNQRAVKRGAFEQADAPDDAVRVRVDHPISAAEPVQTGAAGSIPARSTNPKYDRNTAHRAYMKKYMRKRRAKAKEQEK